MATVKNRKGWNVDLRIYFDGKLVTDQTYRAWNDPTKLWEELNQALGDAFVEAMKR